VEDRDAVVLVHDQDVQQLAEDVRVGSDLESGVNEDLYFSLFTLLKGWDREKYLLEK
jgi:hypothetical protein